MARIKVDTDLLRKEAEEIHTLAEIFQDSGTALGAKISCVGGEYSDLLSKARKDGLAANELIQSIRGQIGHSADTLVALANAFQSIDEEAIASIIRLEGEDWFLRTYFTTLPSPEIEGFEAFYLPQTRMILYDWVPVYSFNDGRLTQIDTYATGRLVTQILGVWTNPKTKKVYLCLDAGGGKFTYVPIGKFGPPIDLSKIPDQEGTFTDGQKVPDPKAPAPLGSDSWNPDWHAAGDPWQYLILGKMNISGIGNASFPLTPHANLCGELAVFFAVGETDIEAGLSRFAKLKGLGYWNIDGTKTEYTGTQVLQNAGHTTSAYDVKRLFEDYGWKGSVSNGVMPAPEEIAEKLRSGNQIVFLTELDTREKIISPESGAWADNPTYGQLVPGAPAHTSGRAAHWVAVTEVFQDENRNVMVKVFNPYSGCEETYTWDTFAKTCKNPGSSTGSYTYVEAMRESE